jgi:methyltransferase family protein
VEVEVLERPRLGAGRTVQHAFMTWFASVASRLGALPEDRRRRLLRFLRRVRRPIRLGSLGRMHPVSGNWGFDRGTPVDRCYVEAFLEEHRSDIAGRVLEVRDSGYTRRYGTNVLQADVLDIDASSPRATIIADLSAADSIPDNQFDCFILTQTLQLIFETRAALAHAHRILRPGGVLLVTVPVLSRLAPRYGAVEDYWRFTPAACMALLEGTFGTGQVTVRAYGNVTSAIAFLAGAAQEDLRRDQLETQDPSFPVVVGARARKASPATD